MFEQIVHHGRLLTFFAALTVVGFTAGVGYAQDSVGDVPQDQPEATEAVETVEGVETLDMVVTVVAVNGRVQVRSDEESPWQMAEQGMELPIGTTVRTGLRGSIDLNVGPNADFSINPLSVVAIGQLQQDGDTIRTLIMIPRGDFNFEVKHIGSFQNDFRIATTTGTMAVKGTIGSGSSWNNGLNLNGDPTNGNNAINFRGSNGQSRNMTGNQQQGNMGQNQGTTGNRGNTPDGSNDTGKGNDNTGGSGNTGTGDTGRGGTTMTTMKSTQSMMMNRMRIETIIKDFNDSSGGEN